MATKLEIRQSYPKQINLAVGQPWSLRLRAGDVPASQPVSVRLMGEGDEAAILEFARNLPEDDLLFLRTDITDAASVKAWIADAERGNSVTLLAELDGSLLGYASVHLNPLRWTRRVGEVRINVAPKWRGCGLGKQLSREILALASSLNLRKLTAQMVADQKQAREVFEHLGFRVEALLPNWIEDRSGKSHDLLVMACELPEKPAKSTD
jgi:L-amino acid N-acyltransferase YncA